jgi:hypothetical protein
MSKKSNKHNQGLVPVNIHVRADLYKKVLVKKIRDKVTVRQVADGLFDGWVKGVFKLEEEKKKVGSEG